MALPRLDAIEPRPHRPHQTERPRRHRPCPACFLGLAERFPAAHITWVVNRAYESLLRGHPDLNATMPYDRGARGGRGIVGFAVRSPAPQRAI